MDSLILSIKAVFPLLVYMSLGYFLKLKNFISDKTLKEMNKLVFTIFIPINLFLNVINSDITSSFDINVLIFTVISVLILFICLCLIIPKFEHDNKKTSVMIQGIFRSNFVLFGLSITTSICGTNNLGMSSILITVIVPIFNVLAVILFEMYRGTKINFKKVIKGVITNPLIIGSTLGLIFLFTKIDISDVILIPLKNLSNIATPLALIILGGTFTFSEIKNYKKQLTIVTISRLIILPIIFLSIAILFGIRSVNLVTLMVLFGSPTAVSSFPMADQMGGDGKLAAYIVVITSIFSIITIFGWTFLLSSFSFI